MQPISLSIAFLLTCLVSQATSLTSDNNLNFEKQALLKVANTLATSLDELRRLEKAKANHLSVEANQLPYPQGGAMDSLVSIEDWEGPLESLLQFIAQKYHYQLNTIGKKPALPILVAISVHNKTLGSVIQDADLQAGKRAYILVKDRPEPTIELRYATDFI